MFTRLFWNSRTRGGTLKLIQFYPIKKGRLLCVCWGGSKYNCNPKAITDEIIRRYKSTLQKKFEIWYAFLEPNSFVDILPQEIKSVQIGSFEYFKILATSQFVISNIRFVGVNWPFPKRQGQYYIQTMHGPHGVKKVEFAAKETLSKEYIGSAIEDNKRIDLMLSNSEYSTDRCKSAFLYAGKILEQGLPRNDIFFSDDNTREIIKNKMLSYIRLQKRKYKDQINAKFLIYAPTFRDNGRKDVYGFNVDNVIKALETRFGGKWYILVSSHPNMTSFYREIYDFSHSRMIDVGLYPELQELLVVCDALITDYSSAEMDFSLTKRPQFQLIRDREDYERGTYLDPRSLPFPYAENDDDLCDRILTFDYDKYFVKLETFNRDVIGLKETGNASAAVVGWMEMRV